ncbi:MAG: hypothetical protein IJM72_02975, partial [Deltaproteobacteria bacterium]|nr:hypothetical protein [Deltaproteobacteria bacterium]
GRAIIPVQLGEAPSEQSGGFCLAGRFRIAYAEKLMLMKINLKKKDKENRKDTYKDGRTLCSRSR